MVAIAVAAIWGVIYVSRSSTNDSAAVAILTVGFAAIAMMTIAYFAIIRVTDSVRSDSRAVNGQQEETNAHTDRPT
jgi:hypothetical protein